MDFQLGAKGVDQLIYGVVVYLTAPFPLSWYMLDFSCFQSLVVFKCIISLVLPPSQVKNLVFLSLLKEQWNLRLGWKEYYNLVVLNFIINLLQKLLFSM